MSQQTIHQKTKKRINGVTKGEKKHIIRHYFISISFVYMLSFAILHYFFDKDSIIINTFGVVFIDMLASFIYYFFYLLQYKNDRINLAYERKKIRKPYNIPLIDKKMSSASSIAAYKIIIFLIVSFILVIYYFIGGYLLHEVEFMSTSNSIEFAMFFMTVAYFDLVFEGGLKKLPTNLRNLSHVAANDNPAKKILFYILIFFVASYQLYTIFTDIFLLIGII